MKGDTEYIPHIWPDKVKNNLHNIQGFIAVAANFEEVKDFAQAFLKGNIPSFDTENGAFKGIPEFKLCPESFGINRILICNFREALVRFVEELIRFQKQESIEILIMVPAGEALEHTTEYFVRHSKRLEILEKDPGIRFDKTGPGKIDYYLGNKKGMHPITIFEGDCSDELELINPAAQRYSIKDIDAVVFSIDQISQSDPDARTALGVLNLLKLHRNKIGLFKSSFKIIAEIDDPDKAELIDKRAFEHVRNSGRCKPITIIPAQKMQNNFIAQTIFVPGIIPIYSELLSESGMELCRLLPIRKTGNPELEITFSELMYGLFVRDKMILLGVELIDVDGKNRKLFLNPAPGTEGYSFKIADCVGICVVANTENLDYYGTTCHSCLSPQNNA